jgi:hypothetical protein
MAMSNIELFDEFTAAALAKLYESFPRKIGLMQESSPVSIP